MIQKKPSMLITAPCGTQSGYGAHSRDIIHSLIKMDKFDIKIWPVRWGSTSQNALNEQNPKDKLIIDRMLTQPNLPAQPDIHVHVVIPNEFNTLGKYNIGITAGTESTVCPPQWIEGINKMDLVLVPSKFTKNVFTSLEFVEQDKHTKQQIGTPIKATTPIEVLFEGVDTDVYKRTNELSKSLVSELSSIPENFVFLFVGHWLTGKLGEDRKDVGMLIKIFLETFKNKKIKPALLLKTSGGPVSVMDRDDILRKIQHIKKSVNSSDLPNIYLLHGDLSDDEMNDLYNFPKIKAMVNLTHGEGYGRPLAEFVAASGKPIITTNWSGQVDFLDKELSILLPGDLVPVPKKSLPDGIWMEGSKWFGVNYQQAAMYMKDVYSHYKKYTLNAKKLQKIIRGKFSLNAMTSEFSKILDSHLPKFEQVVQMKLPKLKRVKKLPSKPISAKLPKLKKV